MMKKTFFYPAIGLMLAWGSCVAATQEELSKPADALTIAAQVKARETMPVDSGEDAEFVKRGFIADPKEFEIRDAAGNLIWKVGALDWIKGDAPPTVNPSLWRHEKLLGTHGLYKVADGVWQVRGLDAANMEIVNGKTGWIVVDPLMTVETAAAAMKLVNDNLGERPVSAVVYGHSHPDHYGGARALLKEGSNVPIYAPEGLLHEASSEFVVAGNSEARRSAFQYGVGLLPGPRGYVGAGLLEGPPKGGTISLLPPTDYIKQTGETREIDGVKFVFQMVPETEAPSEMNFFLPETKVLYNSEDTVCTQHNIQTPRGALVRDANKWAGFITEQLDLWGGEMEALVNGHCWPRFGNEAVNRYLSLQRDNYQFIHDQTVRLMNMGETPTEIAEQFQSLVPKALSDQWSNHGYYGTYKHSSKGVYQRYIGWWDGIPAHFDLYPPVEQGKRYVKAMGGAKGVIKEAQRAMAEGDYRWSAELLNHLVFSQPENKQAKALLADSYEQLGYQKESAIWRDIYLQGAAELRGIKATMIPINSPDTITAMPMASFLDLVATRLNPGKIGERRMTMVLDDGVAENKSLLTLRNAVLIRQVGKSNGAPTVSVSGSRLQLVALFVRKQPLDTLEAAGLKVSGDRSALAALLNAIEPTQVGYNVVTP